MRPRAVTPLLCLLAAACGGESFEGVDLPVEVYVGASERCSTAGGATLELRRLSVVLDSVELVRCDAVPFDPFALVRRALVSTAHAHGEWTPTRIPVPHVLDLTETGALELGAMSPPPGHYCAVRAMFAPADDDAVGLDAAPDMLGRVLWLEGAVRHGDANRQVDWSTTHRFERTITLGDDRGVALDLTDPPRVLRLELALDARIDAEVEGDPTEAADLVLRSVAEGLTAGFGD